MKALILKENSKYIYEDMDDPVVNSEHDVLVKLLATGVCSSDINRSFCNGAYHFPLIPGHEICGEVRTEEGINRKVAVYPLIPCGLCFSCKDGAYNRCNNYDYIGSRRDGGFTEYLVAPKKNLIYLSDSCDSVIGALTEPTAVAVHAFHKAEILSNDNILIVGDGAIGLILARFLIVRGHNVFVVGRHKHKLAIAQAFGAQVINAESFLSDSKFQNFFNIIFELAGSNSAYASVIQSVKANGQIIFVGNAREDVCLQKKLFSQILRKEVRICGSWNSLIPEWEEAVRFLDHEKEQIRQVVSHIFLLKDGVKAMNDIYLNKLSEYVKVVFLIK